MRAIAFLFFPRRERNRCGGVPGEPNEGYGIYLKEGLNEVLFALTRFSIVFSVNFIGWIAFLRRRDLQKSYPWAAVFWITTVALCALEVLGEWLKGKFDSVTSQKSKAD